MFKNFFKTYQEWFLAGIAIVFLAVLVWIFIWGITNLTIDFGKALTPASAKNQKLNFDLEGASRLNLKGLAQ